jgi:hypothetical protein
MGFETLSKTLTRSMHHQGELSALADAARMFKQYRELLREVLPAAIYHHVLSAAQKNQSLCFTVSNHSVATKLYQYQQKILTQFAANSLYFKEIRVFVQPPAEAPDKRGKKPVLSAHAVPALDAAISRTHNEPLKAALVRLRGHAINSAPERDR